MPPLVSHRLHWILPEASEVLDHFADEVRDGLTAYPKQLHCRFLYDDEGSRLFEAITRLDEYYPSRTEEALLESSADEIASRFPDGVELIELGGGSGKKTRLLIEALLSNHDHLRYTAIDISKEALDMTAERLLHDYDALEMVGVVGDYARAFDRLERETDSCRLVFSLGSNVGNSTREEAREFLASLAERFASEDRLLVGIDLRKDLDVLRAAYNDREGVTAAFNKNVLKRINRELGGNFDLDRFSHRAEWDERLGRIKLELVSEVEQTVKISALDLEVPFENGETIHTEDSTKYSKEEIEALVESAGFRIDAQWIDPKGWFSLNLLRTA